VSVKQGSLIKDIPHKILFYFGFVTVFIFILLSYWQFNRYLDTKNDNYAITEHIDITNMLLNDIEENTLVTLNGTFTLIDYYFLRSRVHNGNSGYNLIGIYRDQNESNITINHGWISLENEEFNLNKTIKTFEGILLRFDTQPLVGQDDVKGSRYLFRIEKEFIENDQNIKLKSKYMILNRNCGTGIECVSLSKSYNPPHLSYSFQWIFFSICLSIVILRKNNFI